MTAPRVEVSPWRPAPFDVAGESVFAVGDVHGCAEPLAHLLEAVSRAARMCDRASRLVWLGDMLDRGPSTLGVLKLWAEPATRWGVGRVDRLLGNHEQLVLLALDGGPHAAKARTMWLGEWMGGTSVLDELRAATGRPEAPFDAALWRDGLGETAARLFADQQGHVALGTTVFVHGGLDPAQTRDACLARHWRDFTDARWAWVHGEFLGWRGGFAGWRVVHGHTPPHMHAELTGQADPHEFAFDRLGLDGGTTRTGLVVAGQIEDGRYRIFRAS